MTLKRDEWEKLVGQWRGSRQSARQFAASHGVTDTALRYWANRLAEEAQDERTKRAPRALRSSPALARVVRPGEAPSAQTAGRVMLVVGTTSLVVEPDFDETHLRAVVRALSEVG